VQVRSLYSKEEIIALSAPVRQGEILDVEVEDAHATNDNDGIARIHGYIIDIENGRDYVGQRVLVKVDKVHRTYAKARILER
jgi:ribonuclease G